MCWTANSVNRCIGMATNSSFLLRCCRFVDILDQLDSKVESLRKDAIVLRDKKDFLAMSVDLLKNNEYLTGLNESKYHRPLGRSKPTTYGSLVTKRPAPSAHNQLFMARKKRASSS